MIYLMDLNWSTFLHHEIFSISEPLNVFIISIQRLLEKLSSIERRQLGEWNEEVRGGVGIIVMEALVNCSSSR